MGLSVDEVLSLSAGELIDVIPALTDEERAALAMMLEDYTSANPYLKYNGDLRRIITEEWREGLWSKQEEILESFRVNQRTCIVTTPGIGKSDIVSMIVCAVIAAASDDPSQVRVITTAANFRLVKTIIWPYIKRVAATHGLPGGDSKFKSSRIGSTEWYINDVMVADGVASSDQDETAMRGIHSLGRVVVVVDEASGISHTIGRVLNGLLTTPDDRLIVLGNPPTDQTDTWFEWLSQQAIVNTITIPYLETPNFNGEETPICNRCGPRIPQHTISKHLTSVTSIEAVRAQYPDDNDPYVRAFLYAEFPTGSTAKAIPMQFLERALPVLVRGPLGPDGQPTLVPDEDWLAKSRRGGPIRFGLDIASDGGDEFVIAKRVGWHGSIVHNSSGPTNEDAEVVAGVAKKFILEAVAEHEANNIFEPVVVNVDRTGVGWGVDSILRNWANKEKLRVVVVGVMVGEAAKNNHRFTKQRSEIWWNFRELLADPKTEITIQDDRNLGVRSVVKQLNGPSYETGTDGRIQVETKKKMAARGAQSPDRGDAMLLAFYESPSKRRNVVPPMFPEISQVNVHHIQRYE